MKSVRLAPARQAQLARVARAEGVTQSEFIRRALDRALDEAASQPSLYDDLLPLVGTIELGAEVASRTEEALSERGFGRSRRPRPAGVNTPG